MPPQPKITDFEAKEIYIRRRDNPDISLRAIGAEMGKAVSRIAEAEKRGRELVEGPATAPPSTTLDVAPAGKVAASRLNPRKHFDADDQAKLTESIRARGVLLPVLVRRANQPGNTPVDGDQIYEIVAGERRWRSALAIAHDFPLPIRLIDPCDDSDLIELALIENRDRRDMTAWEEAQAYAALRRMGRSAAAIADRTGYGKRVIEMRLRLVEKLGPEAGTALNTGIISTEYANILAALVPPEAQPDWLDKIAKGWIKSSRDLRLAITRELIPVGANLFTIDTYAGAFITDDDAGQRYFADTAQFRRLQDQAVADKAAELKADGAAWVKICDERKGDYFTKSDYQPSPGHAKAGAVIQIAANHGTTIHRDLLTARDADRDAAQDRQRNTMAAATSAGLLASAHPSAPQAGGGEPFTRAHVIRAKTRKGEALQDRVCGDANAAMRLVCHALLAQSSQVVNIRPLRHDRDTFIAAPAAAETINDFIADLDGEWAIGAEGPASGYVAGGNVKLWQAIDCLRPQELDELFAALVALRLTAGTATDPWDSAETMAIATSLGLVGRESDHGLSIRPGDLDGMRRDGLMAVHRQNRLDDVVTDLAVKDLAGFLEGQADPSYVPPLNRFLPDAAALSAGFADMPKDPRQIDLEEANARAAKPAGELSIDLDNLRRILSRFSVFAARAAAETPFAEIIGLEAFGYAARAINEAFGLATITEDVLLTAEDLDHLTTIISRHRDAIKDEEAA